MFELSVQRWQVSLSLFLSLSSYLCVGACVCVWSLKGRAGPLDWEVQESFFVLFCCIAEKLKKSTNGTSEQYHLHHNIIQNAWKERSNSMRLFAIAVVTSLTHLLLKSLVLSIVFPLRRLQISNFPGCHLHQPDLMVLTDFDWPHGWSVYLFAEGTYFPSLNILNKLAVPSKDSDPRRQQRVESSEKVLCITEDTVRGRGRVSAHLAGFCF